MNFVIITHTPHYNKKDRIYAYAPYVREMNIWGKYVNHIEIVAPITNKEITSIQLPYTNSKISILTIHRYHLLLF